LAGRNSIRDVAREAGVSITTVSRVLNNVDYPVSADLKRRVLNAAQLLDYSPNISAQSLRKTSVDLIGLIVRDIDFDYFGQIARGVTEGSLEKGCLAFVCNTGHNLEKEFAYHELLWQHRVRGVIIAGGGIIDERYREIVSRQHRRMNEAGLKMLALAPQGLDVPCLCYDHEALGFSMTSYLINAGHRDIAFLSGPANVVTSGELLAGYHRALAEQSIGSGDGLVQYGSFDEEGGYSSCCDLLQSGVKFTGICAANDNMAVGAIRALREIGLEVPQAVSIVGIGDSPAGRFASPKITTFDTMRYDLAAQAVDMVLGSSEVYAELRCDRGTLPFKLIQRESVRRL